MLETSHDTRSAQIGKLFPQRRRYFLKIPSNHNVVSREAYRDHCSVRVHKADWDGRAKIALSDSETANVRILRK